MSIASDIADIESAITKARAWKQNASSELATIHNQIVNGTHKKEEYGPYAPGNTERTVSQQTFLNDYGTISSQVSGLATKLEEMCKEYEKYTDSGWVDGFTTDEGSWGEVYGTANAAYESTNSSKLKGYATWKGKDADQYRSNALDQHFAIGNGAWAAEAMQKTCKGIVEAAETFYKALAKEAKWLETNPSDISTKYSKANPPVKSTFDVLFESITDPGGMEENIQGAIDAFVAKANQAFLSIEVEEFPNRPPDKYSATAHITAPWPALAVQ